MIVAGGERKECSWRGKIRRVHRDGPCVGEEIQIRRVHRESDCLSCSVSVTYAC